MPVDRQRFEQLLKAARSLSFEDARALSRLYEDDPSSVAGRARKKADSALKAAGQNESRVAWMREAGSAVIHCETLCSSRGHGLTHLSTGPLVPCERSVGRPARDIRYDTTGRAAVT